MRLVHWFSLVALFFAAYAPTLPFMPFNDGMENFNVLPSMEVAREGQWAVPTLWGLPRVEKPPLAEWLCAGGLLTGGQLEFAARWASLLLACCTLIIIYEWARLFADWRAGLVAAIAAGTSLFFIRFGKRAAYDGPLMFWVALTNLALTWGLFRSQWKRAAIVGGLALGGAMLTKGPPALLHTLAPFTLCLVGWAFWRQRKLHLPATGPWLTRACLTLLVALLISILCMLPWALALLSKLGGHVPQLIAAWKVEVSMASERLEKLKTSPLAGLVFFWLLMPWLIWFIGTAFVAFRTGHRQARILLYLAVMALFPVFVHALIPPMRDRYLLPMLPAAAVAIGLAYMDYVRRFARPFISDRLAVAAHFAILAGFSIGYPLILAASSSHPLSWPAALLIASIGLCLVAAGLYKQRSTPAALVICTFLTMSLFGVTFTAELSADKEPAQAIAADILTRWPDATFYCAASAPLPPRALAIYLDRTIHAVYDPGQIPPGPNRLYIADEANPTPPPGTPVFRFAEGRSRWLLIRLP